MRAAYIEAFGGREILKVGELPKPIPSENEVLVRVKAASLNHLDIWVRRGQAGRVPSFPHILGADGAGIVEEIGSKVLSWKTGDEVILHPGLSCGVCSHCQTGIESLCAHYKILGEHASGTTAEYVVVPAENLFLKPKNLSFELAASCPLVFTTAWQMVVTHGQVNRGEKVLIHAAGSGVSSAAIQIAHFFGAEIFATASDPRKLSLAKSLGVQHVINYKNEDFSRELKKVTKWVDVIIDHVGKSTWDKNISCLKWGGKLILCGATTGYDVRLDLRQVFYRQIQIIGSTMGSKRDFPGILRQLEIGNFKPIVDRSFALDEIREAHALLEESKAVGKLVIKL